MWHAVELLDVHDIALIFENGCFVIVYVEVVGGRKDGHDGVLGAQRDWRMWLLFGCV